ncbi:hypothetical protein D3C86_942070 [compost metagenome]
MFSLAALPASAHSGHEHAAVEAGDHAHHAPHGGAVRTVGKYHYELLAKADKLQVFLLDDALKPLPTAGITGQAVVQVPGKGKQTVTLSPKGDRFEGPAALAGTKAFIAVVSLKLDGRNRSARFKYRM